MRLVGGFAYYTMHDGVSVSGAYAKEATETYITILTSSVAGNKNYFVDLHDNMFTPLDYEPYTAYVYTPEGQFLKEESDKEQG